MEAEFWAEFWTTTKTEDEVEQAKIKKAAELAAKLGSILDYAFCLTLDGQVLDDVLPEPAEYLKAWLGNPSWDHLVLREENKAGERHVDVDDKSMSESRK